jgi:hypothetical protein
VKNSRESADIMLDATTNTTTTTCTDTNEQELGCAMCLATFENKEMKRAHMREEWQ